MMTVTKHALLALLLALCLPLLHGCKELGGGEAGASDDNSAPEPETSVTEPTFDPIQINSAPSSLAGYAGQTATFRVTASSNAILSYQWLHNDAPIAGATGPTFTFVIAGAEDAGTYTVKVSNSSTQVEASAQLFIGDLPEITNEPQDVSIYPGQTAVFSVQASGDNIEYQWQTRSLTGWSTLDETSDTLVVEDVSTSTKKQYRVKVKNGGGTKTSRTTRINLKTPVSISSQPEDQLVAVGSNAYFQVAASGYSTLSYRWYKGNTAISDGNKFQGTQSPNLAVIGVTSADAGLYHVVVSNSDGSSLSSSDAQLAVQGPAVVTVHPSDTTVYAGQPTYLRIAASGDAPLAYQWQKWHQGSWQDVPQANSSSLSVSSTTTAMDGRYRCKVSNNVSNDISNEATVTVLSSVSITSSPTSQTAAVGDSVSFTIGASGDNLQYEWTKNGQVIAGSGNTLSFASVRELDAATYGCRVFNEGSSANCSSFKLTIQSPVQITSQPTSQTTYESGSVTLTVAATGDPTPTVEWYFGGQLVGTGESLALNFITLEQAGEYQCLVKNSVSSVYCDVATVTVKGSVAIQSQPVNTSADEGSSVTFALTATGEDLNYDWSKDGVSLGINSPNLTLSNLTQDNAGTYSCKVWNQNSSKTCNAFTLSINGRIAILEQPSAATAYEDESVTLKVNHSGGSDASVAWYFNDKLLNTTGTSLTLSPLTLEQAGEYRCEVSNPVNTVACETVSVTVLEKVRITKQPASQILNLGDEFTMDIEASGSGQLLYECYFNGLLIISTTNTSQLRIASVTAANAGSYNCTVSNEGTEATTATVKLSVAGGDVNEDAQPVMVSWNPPSNRSDGTGLDQTDISGYSVHVRYVSEDTYLTVANTTDTTTTVMLAPGSYYLTVTTLDSNGQESNMSPDYPLTVF